MIYVILCSMTFFLFSTTYTGISGLNPEIEAAAILCKLTDIIYRGETKPKQQKKEILNLNIDLTQKNNRKNSQKLVFLDEPDINKTFNIKAYILPSKQIQPEFVKKKYTGTITCKKCKWKYSRSQRNKSQLCSNLKRQIFYHLLYKHFKKKFISAAYKQCPCINKEILYKICDGEHGCFDCPWKEQKKCDYEKHYYLEPMRWHTLTHIQFISDQEQNFIEDSD